MNSKTKNGIKSILKWEFDTNENMNIFEKKPKRGGTPANDSKLKEISLVKVLTDPKSEKAKRDLTAEPTDCKRVVNNKNEVTL